MPKVLNKYKSGMPKGSVYIGRSPKNKPPNPWGNYQAEIGPNCTREQAVEAYRKWIEGQPELIQRARQELKGKDLVCFCAPKQCHGDILLKIANDF